MSKIMSTWFLNDPYPYSFFNESSIIVLFFVLSAAQTVGRQSDEMMGDHLYGRRHSLHTKHGEQEQ